MRSEEYCAPKTTNYTGKWIVIAGKMLIAQLN